MSEESPVVNLWILQCDTKSDCTYILHVQCTCAAQVYCKTNDCISKMETNFLKDSRGRNNSQFLCTLQDWCILGQSLCPDIVHSAAE